MKQQAETQLQSMTPEQIEQKIKELGFTREEAARKAAELGISLEQYLTAANESKPSPSTPVTAQQEQPVPQPPTAPVVSEPHPVGISGLPYFGYDIFSSVPAAFEPTAMGPVDPEYVIGPDDVLRLTVWGQVELQNELKVDKEGRIFIPTVGQLLVSGLTLDKATSKLISQMARSYSGLVSRPPTVWLDLTLARLKPKRVFIMGQVPKPGGYTVSSYANVFNSLYSVGGPTIQGSMRDIRVVRDNTTISRVDLYKYLTGAEEANDIRVQNNDIIFVPTRGKTVSIKGEVVKPAIYELKDDENLAALLRYCGGLNPTAYTLKAQIDRIKPFNQRTDGINDKVVVDISLQDLLAGAIKDVALADADEVQVFPVLDNKVNYVTIQGAVWRPGRYELGSIKTLKDLIDAAKGLQPKAYTSFGHIVRFEKDLITRTIIPFDVGEVVSNPVHNHFLQPRDEVIIYSTEALEVKDRFVTIFGEVKNPGRYALRTNMTLQDIVILAGGYTEAAEGLEAEVSRIRPSGLLGDSLAIILRPSLPRTFLASQRTDALESLQGAGTPSEQFLLQHRDEILIRPNPKFKPQQNVVVEGEVTYPGTYSIMYPGERLSEILTRAGGPTKTSYLGGAEYMRGGKRLLVDFDRAFTEKDPQHDVVVLDGDRITVHSKPNTVLVSGEVNGPGLLSFIRGRSVSDYIDRAGGRTDSADYAILTYPTGEHRRVNFGFLRSDPEVLDGSSIHVKKVPPPLPEQKGESVATTVKDMFAILSAAATIVFIVYQTTK